MLAISDGEHRAVIGALDREETIFVLQGAMHAGLVEGTVDSGGRSPRLSFAGWRYFEERERGASTSGRAFMAMQYGNTARDEVFQSCFRPAVEAAGFKLERLDENPRPGLIDNRLRVEIQNSRLLIVDLTAQNRGAHWEAGYAEGLGKPAIYTCRRDEFESRTSTRITNKS